eukprot:CAMPEP_0117866344 /NCGR_PEP_ID=MMETSP0950-20121206/7298_1 /TAXON_ID=44440 /ORGANISM="Chattonella subsalsa, Strain CCMP2191" /LENGTH=373 /DNA_ID=CAMNT_0005717641 /DNA_START=70 /DNA_END=1187 /DNA_ORIENTATION=-
MSLPTVVVGGGYAGTALALALHRKSIQFTLLKGPQSTQPRPDFAVGLWSPALRCLRELGLLGELEKHGRYINASGYKSVAGEWLAQPSLMGSDIDFNACLMFVPKSKVFEVLQKELPEDSVRTNSVFDFFEDKGDRVEVHLQSGTTISGRLIVGADGMWSRVRQQCSPSFKGPSYQGYHVVQGICHQTFSEASFQTWGLNARFAAVPTKDGQQWFATFIAPALSSQSNTETSDSSSLKTSLIQRFESWHTPIASIIDATDDNDMLIENAWSFSKFPAMKKGNCVLIGDAVHLVDPVLAQGAGIAIEDAFYLGNNINCVLNNDFVENQQLNERLKTLRNISHLSQYLGQMRSKHRITIRDSLMQMSPSFIKTPL